jgi:SAM-dependent methyltransferase
VPAPVDPIADGAAPSLASEEAGGREHFVDAELYDFEYRRRRADVTFYRRVVADRMACGPPGAVLDLACGTGRLLVPLLRDGHRVLGVDRAPAMLARAARRVARLAAVRRAQSQLVRADLRQVPVRGPFAVAICAFHSVQHLVGDEELRGLFGTLARALEPGGWLAFDVLPPDPRWLFRASDRRWGRTTFHHPVTGERLVYTTNHAYDEKRRVLHMRLYYQPVDDSGQPCGAERVVRLSHRQLTPLEIRAFLDGAGFRLVGSFGGWDGRPLPDGDGLPADEHVYVAAVPRGISDGKPSIFRREQRDSGLEFA